MTNYYYKHIYKHIDAIGLGLIMVGIFSIAFISIRSSISRNGESVESIKAFQKERALVGDENRELLKSINEKVNKCE